MKQLDECEGIKINWYVSQSCVNIFNVLLRKNLSAPAPENVCAHPCMSVSAAEKNEMPVRKRRRRSESFQKLLSLKSIKWSSSSDQASIYERHAEGKKIKNII